MYFSLHLCRFGSTVQLPMHHYHSTAHEGVSAALTPGSDAVLGMALVVVLAPAVALTLLSHPALAVGVGVGLLLGHVARAVHEGTRSRRERLSRRLGASARDAHPSGRVTTRE